MLVPIPSQFPLKPKHPKNLKSNFDGKVFCVGYNKTGSSSLSLALKLLGFKAHKWRKRLPVNMKLESDGFSYLHPWYADGNFPYFIGTEDISWIFHNPLLFEGVKSLSQRSSSFGDLPWLFLYPLFDQWYPNSKFILSVRSKTRDVVNSSLKMASRLKLKKSDGSYQEIAKKKVYGVNVEEYVMLVAKLYEEHNNNVIEYFSKSKDKKKQLLVINLQEESMAWEKLAEFLECEVPDMPFPFINSAPESQVSELLPLDFDLNWKDFNFSEKFTNFFEHCSKLKKNTTLNELDFEQLSQLYKPINRYPYKIT